MIKRAKQQITYYNEGIKLLLRKAKKKKKKKRVVKVVEKLEPWLVEMWNVSCCGSIVVPQKVKLIKK